MCPERIATASPPKAAVTSPSLTNHISIIMCIIIGTRSSLGSIELCQKGLRTPVQPFELISLIQHMKEHTVAHSQHPSREMQHILPCPQIFVCG